ncbi:MAG: quinol monooxygenase YgiN [Arcticibacterium sp.]|jgi:quinol monooxygenase YgiN
MTKYGLLGQLKAQEGKVKVLADILIKASKIVSEAPGCFLYIVGFEGNTVILQEVWETKKEHDDSLNMPGVRELIGEAIPLLDGPPVKGQELEILGGHGLNF